MSRTRLLTCILASLVALAALFWDRPTTVGFGLGLLHRDAIAANSSDGDGKTGKRKKNDPTVPATDGDSESDSPDANGDGVSGGDGDGVPGGDGDDVPGGADIADGTDPTDGGDTDEESEPTGSETGTLPPPVLGKSVNLTAVRGSVTVRLPSTTRHVPLEDVASVPVGAIVDATRGSVRLTSAAERAGKTQHARFFGGAFQVSQRRQDRGETVLELRGATRPCKAKASASRARKRARKRTRRLWGDGHGLFKVRGRNAAATVRGTRWLVEDRCAGTLVKVTRGKVEVRDFVRRRTILVERGERYLARDARRR